MRRNLASLLLTLLIALSVVAPALAADPTATPPATPPVATDPPPSDPPPTEPPPTEEPAATDEPIAEDPAPIAPPDPEPATDEPGDPDAQADDTRGRPDPTGRYIVLLRTGADATAVKTRHRQREGTRSTSSFGRAFNGFSARLDRAQRQALIDDPNVVAVVPDEVIELAAQTIPTGVSRIGAKASDTAAIDGIDDRVDADVAIVDTGIAYHPDLNVAGGYNCSTSDPDLWRDKEGHGTHVAGTVAALDNDFGVVGVAPGARVWAVKILNDDGYGLLSWYVCGLDWILAQRDPLDESRPLFEAVNMSVTKWGSDDHACGSVNNDILHAAICRVVAGGITVVVAAANDSGYASKRVPASYNEVITVSALADTDGKPGGLGGNRCYSWGGYDKDDTFADFSNYGADVDIIAPGKCIWSTRPGNAYAYLSGTSMATPATTGAVALYKESRPTATPSQVKEALQYLGNLDWKTSTDPDGTHEKLLDVSRIDDLGTFDFAASSSTGQVSGAGGTAAVPIAIERSSTYFERVKFSFSGLPKDWSASWSTSSLLGWNANDTTLQVHVPPGTHARTYDIDVTASGLGTTATTTVEVVVGTGYRWHPLTPVRKLDTRTGLGLSGRFVDEKVRTLKVTGGAIPSDALAITGNLTVTGSTAGGYVSIGPSMVSKPSTSTINFSKGQTIANGITTQLSSGGSLSAVFGGPSGKSTHLILDVTGYFTADASGETWYPTSPTRLLDTTSGNGLTGSFVRGTVRTFQLAGRGPVPADALAVTANVGVSGTTGSGHLSIGPTMTSTPATSVLNFKTGQNPMNNMTLVIGPSGTVSAVVGGSSSTRAHVTLDVTGYYLDGDDGATWYPASPKRQLDTRIGVGLSGSFQDGISRSFAVADGSVPDDAVAVTGNLTATGVTGTGYVAADATMGSTSATPTLTVTSGKTVANGLVLRLTGGGNAAAVFQGPSGSRAHLILDVGGYFR